MLTKVKMIGNDMTSMQNQRPPVSVVVLTWNGLEYTKPCLNSVLRNTSPSDAEVVVVDNGSTDGTVEYLRSMEGIVTLFNAENLGFVRGNNAALRRIDSDRDVILLNNDTEIDDPAWIRKLQATAYAGEDVGVVGCRIRRLDGDMLQHAGTYIPDITYWGQQLGGGETDINQYNIDNQVEGVVFACVYIKRSVIDAVGYLDEDFFSYYEDSDYCLKARRAGFKVMNCGSLTVRHREHGSTSANKVSFSDMFLRSQETFLGKWKVALDARWPYQVHLHSTYFHPVGYAMTARQLSLGLDEQGVSVSYEYLYGPGTVYPVAELRDKSSGVYRIEVIKQRPIPGPRVPRLIYGQGDAFDAVTEGYRIGYTMLETTGVPAEWIEQCNRLDELWVPTPFNEWTFRRSGATVPMRVMPLGLVDTNYFNLGIKSAKIDGVYTFLSVFEWGERKSPEILLRAFNRAFRSNDPVALICRYSNRDPDVNPAEIIRSLKLDPNGGRIVYSENEPVPYYQMGQIYRSVDCFVLPTRGEGWGMPIIEAMACGIPVIASYWSAQQLFMNDSNSYPLQVSLIDAEAKCPYYLGYKWALPDEDHLVHLFRHVFANQEEARAKGVRAAADVLNHWSVKASTLRMRDRIAELTDGQANHVHTAPKRVALPRIGIDVSRTVGQVSGVGRFTAGLVTGLSRLGTDSPAFDYLLFPGFGDFVHPEYSPAVGPLVDVHSTTTITVFRGPLPAFADDDRHVPGLDLVYCTANAFPLKLSGRTAMVVHDTTFLSHPQFHTQENIDLCSRNFERAVRSDCHFVAVSENTRDDFIRYYSIEPSRIDVIHCGIDLTFFRPASALKRVSVQQKYRLPDNFFLYVGSLEPRKNLKALLLAMMHFEGSEKLVIVGAAGWMNSEVHDLIVAAGDRVQTLGYVPLSDLPALYSASRAFVYPSLYEGFGLPVIEAMACGAAVITSDNSSLREIAQGAAVLVAEPEDPNEITKALLRLSDDSSIAKGFIEAGSQRASRFGIQQQAIKHVELFKRMIET